MKVIIIIVEMNLVIVNKDFVIFNINGVIFGMVYLLLFGFVIVVFDGGYVLGEFYCLVCVVKSISLLFVNFVEVQNFCGMFYYDYKC